MTTHDPHPPTEMSRLGGARGLFGFLVEARKELAGS